MFESSLTTNRVLVLDVWLHCADEGKLEEFGRLAIFENLVEMLEVGHDDIPMFLQDR